MSHQARVSIRRLSAEDAERFVEAVARSKALHYPWVTAPDTAWDFEAYLSGAGRECLQYGVWLADDKLVGVVNINAIIRGTFQNGSLGFYAFEGYQRRGLMTTALRQVIAVAFQQCGLHRLEANIQPENESSRRLVERLGFRFEGVGHRLLKINGEWRDHNRFALTVEEWAAPRAE